MTSRGAALLNEADNFTHFPHNTRNNPSVVDLAWVNTSFIGNPYCSLSIDKDGRVQVNAVGPDMGF